MSSIPPSRRYPCSAFFPWCSLVCSTRQGRNSVPTMRAEAFDLAAPSRILRRIHLRFPISGMELAFVRERRLLDSGLVRAARRGGLPRICISPESRITAGKSAQSVARRDLRDPFAISLAASSSSARKCNTRIVAQRRFLSFQILFRGRRGRRELRNQERIA